MLLTNIQRQIVEEIRKQLLKDSNVIVDDNGTIISLDLNDINKGVKTDGDNK